MLTDRRTDREKTEIINNFQSCYKKLKILPKITSNRNESIRLQMLCLSFLSLSQYCHFYLFILPSLPKSLKSFPDLVSKSPLKLLQKYNYVLTKTLFPMRTREVFISFLVLLGPNKKTTESHGGWALSPSKK